jgi:hypothetical protein
MDKTVGQEGNWANLVASLEERYASDGTTTHHIAEGSRDKRPLESHPEFISSIENVTRLSTHNDYPLWGIRCKVTNQCFLQVYYV